MFIANQKVPENYKKEMRNLQSAKQKFDAKEDIQGQKTAVFRKLLADVKGNIYRYINAMAILTIVCSTRVIQKFPSSWIFAWKLGVLGGRRRVPQDL